MGRRELLFGLLDGLVRHASREYEICVGFNPDVRGTSHPLPPEVRWRFANSPGMSAATNAAVSLATGEWLVILADDMIPLPHWDDFRGIREDRILSLELLQQNIGSFPPPVPAGETPDTFRREVAELAAEARFNARKADATPSQCFGTWVLHRSKWVEWAMWPDPYSCNDIAFMWETHLAHPEVAFGILPGRCVYHFEKGSIKFYPERARNPLGEFEAHYGLNIGEAYFRLYGHSERIWGV